MTFESKNTSNEIDELALRLEKLIAETDTILDECDFDPRHRRIQEHSMELFA